MEVAHKLPDGQSVTLATQRFRCPEALFKPSLMVKEVPGYHELAQESIMKSDFELRKALYSNVVLCGGTTMFPGIGGRLTHELELLAKK